MTRAAVLLLTLAGLVASSSVAALADLPVTSNPQLQLDRTIKTSPFSDSAISMKDSEGSAYVPSDNSLWLTGDNDRAIYEVNPTTGALKRKIDRVPFEAATPPGGGSQAGPNRTADFESMAYDGTYLYVFSGSCCTSTVLPTAFRLQRVNGQFEVESYQPLATGSDFTASAWNANESTLYVAKGRTFNSYNYDTNTVGPPVQVPNLIGILGITFFNGGADLFAVTNAETLVRADWATKSIVNGWTFNLTQSGVLDSRAVELIADQVYVSDGYDTRPAGDPLAHAVFVYDVVAPAATPPTASFTASPTTGEAPLTVNFTNTSTGDPTPTYSWTFGDGGTSTVTNPSHTYTSPNTYTVTLTAHNSSGPDSIATETITVSPAAPPTNLVGNPSFDSNTTHWGTNGSGNGVQLTWVAAGRDGTGGMAKLTNTSTNKQKCVLNDVPNWVTTTQAGTYTASIWVRDDTPFGQFKLLLKETGGALNGSQTTTVNLTTNWQQVTVSYTVKSPGTSTLDLQAFVPKNFAPTGTCFYADDVSILKS